MLLFTGDGLDNLILGTAADDTLLGLAGNDTLVASLGDDSLDGGTGTDTADYSGLAGPIVADLVTGTVAHDGDLDTLTSIERVVATASLADTLDYSAASVGVTVTLEVTAGAGNGNDGFGNAVVGFENVIGSNFDDNLTAAPQPICWMAAPGMTCSPASTATTR